MAKTVKKDGAKNVKAAAKAEVAAAKAKPAALDPDVLPKGQPVPPPQALALRHAEDALALERIEESIQRDIALSGKLDKAGAMVGIKIGLALQAGKGLLRHGEYEGWVGAKFGEAFSERKAQYFAKLASAFLRSNEGASLALPAPKDAGKWLVVADDGSALQKGVESFVGDLTLGELLDKHGVRPAKAKGGYRPADWLLKQYQQEHAHLANKVFDVWPQADRDAFLEWQGRQLAGDDAAARRMAAEGTWHSVRQTLADHGLGRKTFALLPREQLEETRDILAEVVKLLNKATKEA